MIAARWALLFAAAWPVLAALGALDAEVSPPAQRLLLAAAIGLLAPLFWPGSGATTARTVLRIVGWSAGTALLAAIALWLGAGAAQHPGSVAATCGMLLLILLTAHGIAALLEFGWRKAGLEAGPAREAGGRAVTAALLLLGSVPLWLGPLAQALAGGREWIVDAVVAASPLTHLAVASGNDLLRNQWLYQHSNLASLAVTYPALPGIVLAYAAVLAALAIPALAHFERLGQARGRR